MLFAFPALFVGKVESSYFNSNFHNTQQHDNLQPKRYTYTRHNNTSICDFINLAATNISKLYPQIKATIKPIYNNIKKNIIPNGAIFPSGIINFEAETQFVKQCKTINFGISFHVGYYLHFITKLKTTEFIPWTRICTIMFLASQNIYFGPRLVFEIPKCKLQINIGNTTLKQSIIGIANFWSTGISLEIVFSPSKNVGLFFRYDCLFPIRSSLLMIPLSKVLKMKNHIISMGCRLSTKRTRGFSICGKIGIGFKNTNINLAEYSNENVKETIADGANVINAFLKGILAYTNNINYSDQDYEDSSSDSGSEYSS